MKCQTLVFGLVVLAVSACGDGKKKKNPAGPYGNLDGGPAGEVVLPGEDSWEEGFDCSAQSVSQSDDCGGYRPVDERSFRVVTKRSKRSNDFFWQGMQEGPAAFEEQCLRSLRISGESFDVAFDNMDFRGNGAGFGARCQVEIGVAYRPGFRFAIRQVSGSILSDFAPGAVGGFKGVYGFAEKRPLIVAQGYEAPGRQIHRLDHVVAPQDLVWSECNGVARIEVDTSLTVASRNFQGPNGPWGAPNPQEGFGANPYGKLEMNPAQPYRFQILWEQCR